MFKGRGLAHILISLLLVTSQSTLASAGRSQASTSERPGILSFKVWKSEKVQKAIAEIVELRREAAIEAQKEGNGKKTKGSAAQVDRQIALSPKLKSQLSQAKINLSVVRELSVTDYFVLYLSQQEKRAEAFREAAKHLDDNEVAELLSTYDSTIRESSERNGSRHLGLGDGPKTQNLN